jgi:hypothetical protein
MGDGTPTRRGFLAATGTALLAGCSGLGQFSEDDRKTVFSGDLPDVADEEEPDPILTDDLPVGVERARLDAARDRTTELLGTVPMAFGPADVPNGYVRQRLIEAAERATDCLEDARTAKTRLSALESLREARGEARYAAAGWAFVADGLTQADVRANHESAVGVAEALRADHEYLGADPVDAALVHARVERHLRLVLDGDPPSIYARASPLLTVAEWGEHAESADALAADGRYLSERFAASLPDDAGSVEATLTDAATAVGDDLRQRRGELPPEPTEEDYDLRERLHHRLRDEAKDAARRVREAQGPASAVLAATEGLVDHGAYDRFRQRADDGEQFGAGSASDVRERRVAALDAIRIALDESPRPGLARPVLVDAARTVAWADRDLGRFQGEVRVTRLDDPMRRYATATLRARSVPAAVRRVVDALGA